MPHYVISYDLKKAKNYLPVWALLESWRATRLLESLWVVTSSLTVGEVRQALQNVVDGDDAGGRPRAETGFRVGHLQRP